MASVKKSTVTVKEASASKPAAVKSAVRKVEQSAAKTEQLAKAAVKTATKPAAPAAKPAAKAPAAAASKKIVHAGTSGAASKAVTQKVVKEAHQANAASKPAKSTGRPSTPKKPAGGSRERMTQVLDRIETKSAPARAPAVLHSNLGSRRPVVVEDSVKIGAPVRARTPELPHGVAQLAAEETARASVQATTVPPVAPAERTTPQVTITPNAHTPRFAHGIAALSAAGGESSEGGPFNHGRGQLVEVPRMIVGQAPAGSPFLQRSEPTRPSEVQGSPGLVERRFEVYNDGLGSYRWRLVDATTGLTLAMCKDGFGTPTAACEAAEREAKLYRPGTCSVIRLNHTPR